MDWGENGGRWISCKNDRIVHSNSALKNAPSGPQTGRGMGAPIMWKHVVHMSSNNCCRIWYYSEPPYLKLTTLQANVCRTQGDIIGWHSSHGRGPRLDRRRYVTIRTYQTGVTVTPLPPLSYIHSTTGNTHRRRQSRVIRADIFSALGKVRIVQQMILLSHHHPDH